MGQDGIFSLSVPSSQGKPSSLGRITLPETATVPTLSTTTAVVSSYSVSNNRNLASLVDREYSLSWFARGLVTETCSDSMYYNAEGEIYTPLKTLSFSRGKTLMILGYGPPCAYSSISELNYDVTCPGQLHGDVLRSDDLGGSWYCLSKESGITRYHAMYTTVSPVHEEILSPCSNTICILGGQLQSTEGNVVPTRSVTCTNYGLSWSEAEPLPIAIISGTVVYANQRIYILGGIRDISTNPEYDNVILEAKIHPSSCLPYDWTIAGQGVNSYFSDGVNDTIPLLDPLYKRIEAWGIEMYNGPNQNALSGISWGWPNSSASNVILAGGGLIHNPSVDGDIYNFSTYNIVRRERFRDMFILTLGSPADPVDGNPLSNIPPSVWGQWTTLSTSLPAPDLGKSLQMIPLVRKMDQIKANRSTLVENSEYIGTGLFYYAGYSLFLSTDGGLSWSRINNELYNLPGYPVSVQPFPPAAAIISVGYTFDNDVVINAFAQSELSLWRGYARRCTKCTPGEEYAATTCLRDPYSTVCTLCRICFPGTYVSSPCTPLTNTECKVCSVCQPEEILIAPCNTTNNTVCVLRSTLYPRPSYGKVPFNVNNEFLYIIVMSCILTGWIILAIINAVITMYQYPLLLENSNSVGTSSHKLTPSSTVVSKFLIHFQTPIFIVLRKYFISYLRQTFRNLIGVLSFVSYIIMDNELLYISVTNSIQYPITYNQVSASYISGIVGFLSVTCSILCNLSCLVIILSDNSTGGIWNYLYTHLPGNTSLKNLTTKQKGNNDTPTQTTGMVIPTDSSSSESSSSSPLSLPSSSTNGLINDRKRMKTIVMLQNIQGSLWLILSLIHYNCLINWEQYHSSNNFLTSNKGSSSSTTMGSVSSGLFTDRSTQHSKYKNRLLQFLRICSCILTDIVHFILVLYIFSLFETTLTNSRPLSSGVLVCSITNCIILLMSIGLALRNSSSFVKSNLSSASVYGTEEYKDPSSQQMNDDSFQMVSDIHRAYNIHGTTVIPDKNTLINPVHHIFVAGSSASSSTNVHISTNNKYPNILRNPSPTVGPSYSLRNPYSVNPSSINDLSSSSIVVPPPPSSSNNLTHRLYTTTTPLHHHSLGSEAITSPIRLVTVHSQPNSEVDLIVGNQHPLSIIEDSPSEGTVSDEFRSQNDSSSIQNGGAGRIDGHVLDRFQRVQKQRASLPNL